MNRLFLFGLAVLLAPIANGVAEKMEPADPHAGHALGKVSFPVSCSPQAQLEFNHAVALLHHMTYPAGARGLRSRSPTTDPDCAMAHWGIAMTLFQPLWPTRPGPDALQRGWDEVEKAKSLKPPTERERLFVAAAEAFFLDPASKDYWLRIRRWEQAMEKSLRGLSRRPRGGSVLRAGSPRHRATRHDLAGAFRPRGRDSAPGLQAEPGSSRRDALSRARQRRARVANANHSRSRANTKRSPPTIRTRCTCRRISTPGSVTGTA